MQVIIPLAPVSAQGDQPANMQRSRLIIPLCPLPPDPSTQLRKEISRLNQEIETLQARLTESAEKLVECEKCLAQCEKKNHPHTRTRRKKPS